MHNVNMAQNHFDITQCPNVGFGIHLLSFYILGFVLISISNFDRSIYCYQL